LYYAKCTKSQKALRVADFLSQPTEWIQKDPFSAIHKFGAIFHSIGSGLCDVKVPARALIRRSTILFSFGPFFLSVGVFKLEPTLFFQA
jgi:hypothetical protein